MPGPTSPTTNFLLAFAGLYLTAVAVFAWLVIDRRRSPRQRLVVVFAVASTAALAATLFTGKRHDYYHYVGQWAHTMGGGDPWAQDLGSIEENPGYGPLFNVFAPIAEAHELLPKVLFAAAWLATAAALAHLFRRDPLSRAYAPAVLAYFLLNPYFWIQIALYGHFDMLPAAAALLSVHLVIRGRQAGAGAALAIGTLLKVVPMTALPFVAAESRRRRGVILVAFAAVVAAVETASYLIWGRHALTFPLLAEDPNSKLLSIFAFLSGDYSPLQLFTDAPDVDWMSLPLLVLAGLLLVWGLALRRAHLVVSVVVVFIVVLALYLRGHQQFQMLVFVLLPYLFLTLENEPRRNRLLWMSLALYVSWISAFSVVYAMGGQLRSPPWVELREIVGLPSFVISAFTVSVLLRFRHAPLRVPPAAPPGRVAVPRRQRDERGTVEAGAVVSEHTSRRPPDAGYTSPGG